MTKKRKGTRENRADNYLPLRFHKFQFTIYKINNVIANEVKQSHISEFKLLRRFFPCNDIDGLSETVTYVHIDLFHFMKKALGIDILATFAMELQM